MLKLCVLETALLWLGCRTTSGGFEVFGCRGRHPTLLQTARRSVAEVWILGARTGMEGWLAEAALEEKGWKGGAKRSFGGLEGEFSHEFLANLEHYLGHRAIEQSSLMFFLVFHDLGGFQPSHKPSGGLVGFPGEGGGCLVFPREKLCQFLVSEGFLQSPIGKGTEENNNHG